MGSAKGDKRAVWSASRVELPKSNTPCHTARFSVPPSHQQKLYRTPEQVARLKQQRELTGYVLAALPENGTTDGVTLADLQELLQQHGQLHLRHLRPAVLLEAVQHLQFAGRVRSSVDQPGEALTHRRYWAENPHIAAVLALPPWHPT